MNLQERCDKAHELLLNKKKELEALVLQYREASQDGRSPLDLLDVKDDLIAYSLTMTSIMLRTKELHLQAQRERESAYTTKFLEERSSVNDKTGKPESIDHCKMMAQLKCAQEYVIENLSEINFFTSKYYRDECQRSIDAVIQRVSVLKGEQFNSRQTTAA